MKKFFTFFTSVLITATAFGQDIELNGTVSAQNNQIKNVADPTDDQDAVTKSYVDALSNTQSLLNFNGWDNYQVWNDGTSVQLTPNSFVFVNANETTLIFPDSPENCCFGDVIYVYVMDGDPLTPLTFNLKANGFPVAFGGGDMPLEFTVTDTIRGVFLSVGLKTIVKVGDYWMVADFLGQIITDSDIDSDADGYSENQGDCDDSDAFTYPGATEIEDGIDNNCDGIVDNCSIVADFTGDYLIEEITPYVNGPTLNDGAIVTVVTVAGNATQRTFDTANYVNYCSTPNAFTFELNCGQILMLPEGTQCNCSCGGNLWFTTADAPTSYDPADDSMFEVSFTNDAYSDCGPPQTTTYRFTKQ